MKAEDCLLLYSPISWVTFTWALVTVCNRGSTRLVLEYDPEFHIKTCAKYKVCTRALIFSNRLFIFVFFVAKVGVFDSSKIIRNG